MYLDECDYKKKYKCKCGVKTLENRLSDKGVFCELNCIKRYSLRIEETGLEYHFDDDLEDNHYYFCDECEKELEEVD